MEGEYSKEALDERLSSIETQATNLSQIINSFKDFYSSETSIIETSIDLVVESSLDIVDAQFKANDIIVNTNLKDKKTIKISPSYLKQAIIAILQNAQEAFKEQQAQDKIIEVSTYTREDSHIIEISDNAGGIPEEIIENIFTPYFSTKESKNGTGLGLYMAKMIIDKHSKGTLCVNNNEDGAVFRITI